jgi:hypothetical protein
MATKKTSKKLHKSKSLKRVVNLKKAEGIMRYGQGEGPTAVE